MAQGLANKVSIVFAFCNIHCQNHLLMRTSNGHAHGIPERDDHSGGLNLCKPKVLCRQQQLAIKDTIYKNTLGANLSKNPVSQWLDSKQVICEGNIEDAREFEPPRVSEILIPYYRRRLHREIVRDKDKYILHAPTLARRLVEEEDEIREAHWTTAETKKRIEALRDLFNEYLYRPVWFKEVKEFVQDLLELELGSWDNRSLVPERPVLPKTVTEELIRWLATYQPVRLAQPSPSWVEEDIDMVLANYGLADATSRQRKNVENACRDWLLRLQRAGLYRPQAERYKEASRVFFLEQFRRLQELPRPPPILLETAKGVTRRYVEDDWS